MDNKKYIKNVGKFHIIYVKDKKTLVLASGNSSDCVYQQAVDKISDKIDKFKNKFIVILKIKTIDTDEYQLSKNTGMSSYGGPIQIKSNVYQINDNGEFIMNELENRNVNIYLSQKYLDDNHNILLKDLIKIAYKTINKKFDYRLMAVNIYK